MDQELHGIKLIFNRFIRAPELGIHLLFSSVDKRSPMEMTLAINKTQYLRWSLCVLHPPLVG